jgi:hypothetical protein
VQPVREALRAEVRTQVRPLQAEMRVALQAQVRFLLGSSPPAE